MRNRPSKRCCTTTPQPVSRWIPLPSSMGSRKNRATEKPMPRITEIVIRHDMNFSLPSFFSSHWSSLEGSVFSSVSSSIPDFSADHIRDLTPEIMESEKLTTPRIIGQVRMPVSFLSGSTFSFRPSFGAADDHGLLVRPAHHDALDQRLTADHGFELFLERDRIPFSWILNSSLL